MPPRTWAALVAAGVALLSIAGCSAAGTAAEPAPVPASPSPAARPPIDLGDCAPQFLTTVTAGQLTVGIPQDSGAPFLGTERNSAARLGAEVDVVHALAEALGFGRTAVVWKPIEVDPRAVVVPDSVDLVIGQLPVPLPGVALASFTRPYLDDGAVVIARADAPAAQARSLADLAGLRVAAWPAGGGAEVAAAALRPADPLITPARLERARARLLRGRVDVLVSGVVAAGGIVAGSDGDLVIVGRLPASEQDPAIGLALATGNPLLPCVDRALGEVVAAGVARDALGQWLGDGALRQLAP